VRGGVTGSKGGEGRWSKKARRTSGRERGRWEDRMRRAEGGRKGQQRGAREARMKKRQKITMCLFLGGDLQ